MWKKSEVWRNHIFRAVVLLEAVLLIVGIAGLFSGERIVDDEGTMEIALNGGEYLAERQGYYIDESYGYTGVFLEMKPGRLTPGVYSMRIQLEADVGVMAKFGIENESDIFPFRNLLSNSVLLYGGTGERTCQFTVRGAEDNAKITVTYEGGSPLLIRGISVVRTNAGSRILICLTLVGAAFADTLIMLYCYLKKHDVSSEKKLVWFGVPGVAVLASVPLFVDYMIGGADPIFHWQRIEALAQSIAQGEIPARVEAFWLYGHGYANSIFYCDTFLVFPALMRLIGFDMIASYNTYVFAVNIATALVAYLCFKGCFRDDRVGVVGSLLYTLAPFRIYNVYNRCAVGEYTAMIFLPVVVYGFYRIFTDDVERREYRQNWLILALGFGGIIQSHVLTCEIAGGFTVILCLLLIKKVFRRQTFLELLKGALGAVLLSLWYLVPFFDMMLSGKYYFSRNAGNLIQKRGVLPAHIFDTMQAAGTNAIFYENGFLDTEPISVGMAMLLGIGAFWLSRDICRDKRDERQDLAAVMAFFIGAAALIASTCYFPWDAIHSWNEITALFVSILQFPTRLTIVPTVCMTFVSCAGAAVMLRCENRFWKNVFFVIVCGAAVIFSLYQTNDILMKKGEVIRLYTVENMGHTGVIQAEYLPLEAELNFYYHEAVPSAGVEVFSFEKTGLDMTAQVRADSGEGERYLDFPVLLYKGYRAQDVETGDSFPLQPGENYDVRVALPGGYNGMLRVWYAGMWYWRAAELASLVFAAAAAVHLCRFRHSLGDMP